VAENGQEIVDERVIYFCTADGCEER